MHYSNAVNEEMLNDALENDQEINEKRIASQTVLFPDKIDNFLQKKIDQFRINQINDFVDEVESEAESENRKELRKKINIKKKGRISGSMHTGLSGSTAYNKSVSIINEGGKRRQDSKTSNKSNKSKKS